KRRKRVAFYTFGCRLNQAETAIIEKGFAGGDFEVVDYRQGPDLLVVNTCTVTENGDADTRRLVNRIARDNPDVRIALVGCQAQVQKGKLLDLPNIDWVVGNARKMEMARIVRESPWGTPPQLITPTIKKEPFTIPFPGVDARHTRANLKIQDGCDFFCSFCEIPYARGRARSRDFADILDEAQHLTRAGHHELVLTGINIGTYREEERDLVAVIRALAEVPDLWRIRISSIEPTTIAHAVLEDMAQSEKLCRHLHIPLQAGSEAILSAMQRKYSVGEFRDFLMLAHRTIPGVCLGTDVIVGFPGEDEAAFEESYALLLDLPFAYFHVFSYSDRDHAKASSYEAALKVAPEVIKERSRRLRELSNRKRRVYQETFLGTEQLVLFEQHKKGVWSGLTDTYIRVEVRSEQALKNQLLPVRLERLAGQNVEGRLVD
ncbi:MAG TPA: tRNA (N(6)-L-threonylcarbamoyladenosine(37)-C(2))-methylthiotransferase MtaB, partial [Calditrichia bacterium]|nr:tRNA (N(6)-L-threonylcarbamoyladenosine(37)-C(2))-methylthiotransferase MtaB [Calditrichia bacterium]